MPVSFRSFLIRLVLCLSLALIPLGLFAILNTPNAPDLEGNAQRAANAYERLLNLRREQVFTFAALPSIRAFTSSTPETRSQRAAVALDELQAWVAADTNVREAFIIDPGGIVIMTTSDDWNSNISARRFTKDALGGQIAVSPVARDHSEYSTYYAAPVLNNKQEIAGALVARIVAQELWAVTPHGDTWYTVLADENGVRLDDSGDPARRLTSFGSMDAARATEIANAEVYGAEMPQVRATNLSRAQDLLTSGALAQITPADFDAGAVTAQRLVSLPWTVLVISPQSTVSDLAVRAGLPLIAAILLALGGAYLLKRL